MKSNKQLSINIISDKESWISSYIRELISDVRSLGHKVNWVHDQDKVEDGDLCFILGCSKILNAYVLDKNNHNLVVHESNLPYGRGWSPLSWQILEDKNKITVTLFEADVMVDRGVVYMQEDIYFEGNELIDELRQKQASTTMTLCINFINNYPDILSDGREQIGESSYFRRRTPDDSKLDPQKTIAEQFNLLRIVDNCKYPAFFDLNGSRYVIEVKKI